MTVDDWWTTFYSGNWSDVQRTMYGDDRTREEATVIREYLGLEPGMRALDVPIGNGRIALGMASEGISITGVDFSAEMLEDARRGAHKLGVTFELRQSDMRDLPWREEFDGAYCWWGSFGYFDDKGNEEFMRAVARTLKPGARFLIDTHCAESLYPKLQPRGWDESSGSLIVEERTMDIVRGRIDSDWRIFRDGHFDERHSSIRLYTYRQHIELFEATGFSDVQGWNGRTREPFAWGSGRLVMTGKKV